MTDHAFRRRREIERMLLSGKRLTVAELMGRYCVGRKSIERKGRQSEQGYLCVRFICFGNGNLGSLYDRSYGFFCRQIVLTVKEREPGREDDPFLGEKADRRGGGHIPVVP